MAAHPNKHIRAAIEYAEERGWEFVKSSARAHRYGALYCPFEDRTGCIVPVYSTPRSPENHARWIRRQVDRCPHKSWRTYMLTYEFQIVLAGIDMMTDEIADALFEAGCDDGSPFSSEGVAAVGFSREAPTLEEAVRSAIADVNKAGFSVARVEATDEPVFAKINRELARS